MTTFRLGLLFQRQGKNDSPGPASSHLCVLRYKKEGDSILISPRAHSFSEFRGYLNELRRELDAIEKEAKQKYAADGDAPPREPTSGEIMAKRRHEMFKEHCQRAVDRDESSDPDDVE